MTLPKRLRNANPGFDRPQGAVLLVAMHSTFDPISMTRVTLKPQPGTSGTSHIDANRRAIAEDANVRGFFYWSRLDNFERAEGYANCFGLAHGDDQTQKRTPKASYHTDARA